ncbi:type III-B CRISPR module-associated protein Cmr5 [Rosettibacter firmus]|uniref:type III-B CRISPR module-associated protein Cmr5 n=1 Tax=Rosettibacter firmus TaxID=3111522 RepID=UPI00336C1F58
MSSKLDNGRASFAFQCADTTKQLSYAKEYKQYSKKLPMMIKTNGLAATFAFMLSKDQNKNEGKAYHKLGDDILYWLKTCNTTNDIFQNKSTFKDLVQDVINLDSFKYNLITQETINFLLWLRRFTEGLIND